ncbi:MAG: diaminopimelate epimerase [Fimbriimonadales bacterium]|nr:diaminopimelate epimerase [Fimbriimonadales bacterium]
MRLPFIKMHGLGNDFILVDGVSRELPAEDWSSLARLVNDRHRGIGGDGLILILKGESAPFKMRMFNPDGSEAEMCGNGIRCVGKYVWEAGLWRRENVPVETGAGLLDLKLNIEGNRVVSVTVDMGKVRTKRGEIPMQGPPEEEALSFELQVNGASFLAGGVSMGNPHCVIFVPDVEEVDLEEWGPKIETHPLFPERTNVHFAQVLSPREILQRTWERGAGKTLACGTGACAVQAVAYLTGRTEEEALIHLPGGDLFIAIKDDRTVLMTGPAEAVFEGVWETVYAAPERVLR